MSWYTCDCFYYHVHLFFQIYEGETNINDELVEAGLASFNYKIRQVCVCVCVCVYVCMYVCMCVLFEPQRYTTIFWVVAEGCQ